MCKLFKQYNYLLIICCCIVNNLTAQKLEILNTNCKASLRGLSVVNSNVIWASGSNGTVLKSTNGGNSWQLLNVPNFEKRDFRDIEAFDSNTAIIMCVADPAFILKTTNGGTTWNTVFADSTKGMFLDAMYFENATKGIIVGDPIDGKAFVATTNNGGNTWSKFLQMPLLDTGEAFFAASGSNVLLQKDKFYFVTGGKNSRLFTNTFFDKPLEIPIAKGFETTGANSLAVYKNKAIIVGGDFAKDSIATNNCVLFNTKNNQFTKPNILPNGYRSCVIFINKKTAVACGLNGVDISYDEGNNWQMISKQGFHIVAQAKKGKSIFLAGGKGKIAKLIL